MEFFDRKEEVIDIQLTPYGKYLLSSGRWKPTYYAFFDNDVIYDVAHTSITENQKDSSDRIKESVRMKNQSILYGIETSFSRLTKEYNIPEKQGTWTPPSDPTLPSFPLPPYDNYTQNYDLPLGNSSLNSTFFPSFDVRFYSGFMSSSSNHYTGSISTGGGIPEAIPQINCNLTFKTSIGQDLEFQLSDEETAGPTTEPAEKYLESGPPENRKYSAETYADGTYISIELKRLLFDVLEKNSVIDKENFDLEVYKVETVSKGGPQSQYEKEQLTPLRFVREDPAGQIVNIGESIYNKLTNKYYEIDSSFVEYYFDIRVDNEIEPVLTESPSPIVLPTNPEEPCVDQ
jgi:hypothetical protein